MTSSTSTPEAFASRSSCRKRGLKRISGVHQMRCTGRPLSSTAWAVWRPQIRSEGAAPAK